MTKLVLGIVLWSVVHFVPAVAAGFRKNLIAKIGEKPYKGLFAVFMVLALYLVISGWKATIPVNLYLPPVWGRHVTALLMLVAFVLFLAPYHATNVKRFLRHPQLTGVIVWGIGHLLANGESRSIVLFGGLTAWAFIEILLLNRRDGAWVKPDPVPAKKDVILVVAGLTFYLIVAFSHRWLFGFSPFA